MKNFNMLDDILIKSNDAIILEKFYIICDLYKLFNRNSDIYENNYICIIFERSSIYYICQVNSYNKRRILI